MRRMNYEELRRFGARLGLYVARAGSVYQFWYGTEPRNWFEGGELCRAMGPGEAECFLRGVEVAMEQVRRLGARECTS